MNSTFIHVYIYCAFLLPFRSCIYKVFCVNNIMYKYFKNIFILCLVTSKLHSS